MPKEIYIDENGNEQVLSSSPSGLSGLIDTAISSATQGEVLAVDSNGKWANVGLTSVLTITPSTGVTIGKNSSGRVGNMVFLALRLNVSVNATEWTTIATINANAVDEVRDSFLLSGSATIGGMIRVDTSGNLQIFPLSPISSGNVEINMIFRCS